MAQPTDEARKLYGEFLSEAHKRELSGSENFDKSVLTLSSAGLGLSVSFLKDQVPVNPDVVQWLLYGSWALFAIATVSTMSSFLTSGKAIQHQKTIAEKFYIQGDADAFDAPNSWNSRTTWLNRISAGTFGSALVLTIAFIVSTLEGDRKSVV